MKHGNGVGIGMLVALLAAGSATSSLAAQDNSDEASTASTQPSGGWTYERRYGDGAGSAAPTPPPRQPAPRVTTPAPRSTPAPSTRASRYDTPPVTSSRRDADENLFDADAADTGNGREDGESISRAYLRGGAGFVFENEYEFGSAFNVLEHEGGGGYFLAVGSETTQTNGGTSRIEIEGLFHTTEIANFSNADANFLNFTANGYIMPNVDGDNALVPYLGGGVGVSILELEQFSDSDTGVGFAFQVMTGLQQRIGEDVFLDVGIRYVGNVHSVDTFGNDDELFFPDFLMVQGGLTLRL